MPPVRWKALVYVTILTLLPLFKITDAQHMHDSISMSADGWRPIVGSRRHPPAFVSDVRINQHKSSSPNAGVDIVKSESSITISSTSSPNELQTKPREVQNDINNNIHGIYRQKQGDKIPPHTKLTPPPGYRTLPSDKHRPQIPLNGVSVGRPSQFGIKKPISKSTSSPHFSHNQKRKPTRVQVGAHSVRNEVYLQPPNSGGFSFIKPGPSNVKAREVQGLSQPGTSHFTVNQPNSHIEFTNRFAPPSANSNVFEQYKSNPVTYIFSSPTQFKTQNDDYTRNLVPPPPQRLPQEQNSDNSKLVPKLKDNVVVPSISEPVIRLNDFGFRQGAQFALKPPQFQDNLVAQIPISFDQNFSFQKQFKSKPQAVDVQVTKENLKVYHNNALGNFNQRIPDYTDYDFHAVNNPVNNIPKQPTYEVTEGKWIDNPNPYTFSFPSSHQLLPQRIKPIGTARPTLIAEPLVELNLPPFLPTPFRPEGTVASPSQTEVSTVFSQVSSKMNKYKNEALTTHPLFFDVKEVSTHYPVLGNPEYIPEAQTDTPLPMNENGEISNEITTHKEEVPTQRPKTRRRRPQPRRTTTSTTTTTEEPVTENLSYELQKDNYNSEMSMETERPVRRQRPRPNRFRTGSSFENDDRMIHYRITTPSGDSEEMSNEKRNRGRHRYRQRGNAENTESRHPTLRKRIRPTTTEIANNHKLMETEAPFLSSDANVGLGETQGLFETQSPQLQYTRDDDLSSKQNRFEYKQAPVRHSQQNQVQDENAPQYDTASMSNEMSGLKLTIEEVTQSSQPIITTIPEETTMVNVNSPENEVDYSTPSSTLDQQSAIETTSTTTTTTTQPPPTTTTEIQTTKTTRTRGRPNKYNAASRPRFSVKDYRQRLNQYTSTTPSTTTDFSRISEEPKLRFPSRIRTRPTTSTTASTQQTYPQEEDETAEPSIRRRFKPKDPRHGSTTESSDVNIITEMNIKSINTRLRPFGRHRSTTESTNSNAKVSIRPNLFNSARRRPPLSMRNKLSNVGKNLTEETTLANDAETTEIITTQVTESTAPFEPVTEFISIKKNIEASTEAVEPTTINMSEDDYSQRVSDLTSSFKNEYETPGLFKSVSPNTRRIPNYFTISTDDPILPIEAFFPNLKDKDKEKE